MSVEPEDLSAISEALAPALEHLMGEMANTLRREFAETLGEILNQLELLAQQVIVAQTGETEIAAAAAAYREFVVGEAKKLLVKPSEIRGGDGT